MKYADVIAKASEIIEEYATDELVLTLRQMYYQFVARGIIPNGQKHYKALGQHLTNARYRGDLDPGCLEDRGRSITPADIRTDQVNVDSALADIGASIVKAPNELLWRSRWWDQPNHVSVWVEKEALAGVFEPTCKQLGVGFAACRGYPSVSMLNEWLESAVEVFLDGFVTDHVILYFGDHDPDGFCIPEAAEDGLHKLAAARLAKESGIVDGEIYVDIVDSLRFERIALNMDQIRELNPPPFPAKETSSRFDRYVREHGVTDAWELDALDPRALRRLIESSVVKLFDPEIAAENRTVVSEARRRMSERMTPDWFAEVIARDQA